MNIFGNIVKKWCIDNQITQQQIANNMMINQSAVANLLNRDNISLDKMQAIARALNCKLVIDLVPIDDTDKTE